MSEAIKIAVLIALICIFIIEHNKDECVETGTHKCAPSSVNEEY